MAFKLRAILADDENRDQLHVMEWQKMSFESPKQATTIRTAVTSGW